MLMVRLVYHPCAWSTEPDGTGPGECHRHAATINVLPDDIFLEIFAFCVRDPDKHPVFCMRQWRRLVQACQRWRQIIYASPRYLDLLLYCSKGTPVRNLSYWPAFPIAISYHGPYHNDDVIALLKHPDRVRLVDLSITSSQSGRKVVAAMQKPFPALTHLELYASVDVPELPVLPSGLLGGPVPCLQQVHFDHIPFPELPTLLLSARDLVSPRLNSIPPTGYISPEAMVAGLAILTRLETLCVDFEFRFPPPEQRRKYPDPPIRAALPSLTEFEFRGRWGYLGDLLARLDAP